jgi:hypothetical protein
MAGEMTVHIDQASIRRMQASIDKLQAEMGADLKTALQWNATAIARSLAKATRSAPKHAPVEEQFQMVERVSKRTGKMLKPRRVGRWMAKRYIGGREQWIPIRPVPSGKRDAQKSRTATIWMRGLAKASWWWIGKKVSGSGGNQGRVEPWVIRRGAKYNDVTQKLEGWNPSITLSNKLDYATSALDGGASAVSGAMDKAARGVLHRMRETMKRNGVTV